MLKAPVAQLRTLGLSHRIWNEVIALAEEAKELILRANLVNHFRLVSFQVGKIEFAPTEMAPKSLAGDLKRFLDTIRI